VRDIVPLTAYFLAILVIVSTVSELVQGALARAKNTHEFFTTAMRGLVERNRRRYGGYLIHIGAAMMAIGVIGSQVYTTDTTRALKQGESMEIRGYTLTYENLSPNFPSGEGEITSAAVGVFRDGKRVATLSPERGFYPKSGETATTPAIYSTTQEDLYLIIAGWEDNFATVTFRAYVNPLVFWLWFGGFFMIVSTLIAAWPDAREESRVRVEGLAKEAVRA